MFWPLTLVFNVSFWLLRKRQKAKGVLTLEKAEDKCEKEERVDQWMVGRGGPTQLVEGELLPHLWNGMISMQ